MQIKCFRASEHSTAPGAQKAGGVLSAPSPVLLSLYLFILATQIIHTAAFQPECSSEEAYNELLQSPDGLMNAAGGADGKTPPVWCCLLRRGLPFPSRYISIIWVLCSLGVGWKWGTGKSFTCNTRRIINYQLPSCSLPPHPQQPPMFSAIALLVGFF